MRYEGDSLADTACVRCVAVCVGSCRCACHVARAEPDARRETAKVKRVAVAAAGVVSNPDDQR